MMNNRFVNFVENERKKNKQSDGKKNKINRNNKKAQKFHKNNVSKLRKKEMNMLKDYDNNFPVMSNNMNDTDNNNIVKYNLNMFDEDDKITNINNNTVCKKFTINNIDYTYDNNLKEGWVLLRSNGDNRANINYEEYKEKEEYEEKMRQYEIYTDIRELFNKRIENGEMDLSWLREDELIFEYESDDNCSDSEYDSDYSYE